jgi:hypothetical protein
MLHGLRHVKEKSAGEHRPPYLSSSGGDKWPDDAPDLELLPGFSSFCHLRRAELKAAGI